MVAYLQAVRQYNQGKTEKNLKILAKHTGIDQGLLKKMCWPAVRNDGQFNVESVLNFQQWAKKRGYLDHLLTEKEFWDPSFIDYAIKVLSTPTR